MSVKIRFGVHFSLVMIRVPFKITSNTEEEEEFLVLYLLLVCFHYPAGVISVRAVTKSSAVRPDFRGKGGGGQAS